MADSKEADLQEWVFDNPGLPLSKFADWALRDIVYLVTIKGNLKHRVRKLALEMPWPEMTLQMRLFRLICYRHQWATPFASKPNGDHHRYGPCELQQLSERTERGEWTSDPSRLLTGGGAFFCLTPGHSRRLAEDPSMLAAICEKEPLRSKHMIISGPYYALVEDMLAFELEQKGSFMRKCVHKDELHNNSS